MQPPARRPPRRERSVTTCPAMPGRVHRPRDRVPRRRAARRRATARQRVQPQGPPAPEPGSRPGLRRGLPRRRTSLPASSRGEACPAPRIARSATGAARPNPSPCPTDANPPSAPPSREHRGRPQGRRPDPPPRWMRSLPPARPSQRPRDPQPADPAATSCAASPPHAGPNPGMSGRWGRSRRGRTIPGGRWRAGRGQSPHSSDGGGPDDPTVRRDHPHMRRTGRPEPARTGRLGDRPCCR